MLNVFVPQTTRARKYQGQIQDDILCQIKRSPVQTFVPVFVPVFVQADPAQRPGAISPCSAGR